MCLDRLYSQIVLTRLEIAPSLPDHLKPRGKSWVRRQHQTLFAVHWSTDRIDLLPRGDNGGVFVGGRSNIILSGPAACRGRLSFVNQIILCLTRQRYQAIFFSLRLPALNQVLVGKNGAWQCRLISLDVDVAPRIQCSRFLTLMLACAELCPCHSKHVKLPRLSCGCKRLLVQ